LRPGPYDRRWWTLLVLCFSLMVIGIDNTILNVAIPTLGRDLHASTSQLQWMIDAYTIVFAGLLLTAGSLGDRFGRKGALSSGLLVFGLGSVLSAFSGSPNQLIATRALMGVGGAFIMPSTLSILTNVFTVPAERAKAIGVWAGVAALGIAVGPIAGGWLLQHFWWGSVFLVNAPVVTVALITGRFLVPTSRDPREPRLDPVGAVLSIGALVWLVWAIIEAPHRGWTTAPVVAAFVIGAVILAQFVFWERRNPHPMLDVRFFENPRFTAASAAITMVFFALFGTMFVLIQYLQSVLGYTPLEAGVRLGPVALVLMVAAFMSSTLVHRLGTKAVVGGGLTLVAVGLVLLATLGTRSGYPQVLAALAALGLGMGNTMAPATDSIMGSLPRAKAGVGSAVNDTTRQVGGALGVAILGSVLASGYRPAMGSFLQGKALPRAAAGSVRDSVVAAMQIAQRLPGAAGRALADAARDRFVGAMHGAVLVAAGVALLGAVVVVLFLPARESDYVAPDSAGSGPPPVDAQPGREPEVVEPELEPLPA
jgi:EmrB/QacA subfamily drug resistance transporter